MPNAHDVLLGRSPIRSVGRFANDRAVKASRRSGLPRLGPGFAARRLNRLAFSSRPGWCATATKACHTNHGELLGGGNPIDQGLGGRTGMKKSGPREAKSASELIDARITELSD